MLKDDRWVHFIWIMPFGNSLARPEVLLEIISQISCCKAIGKRRQFVKLFSTLFMYYVSLLRLLTNGTRKKDHQVNVMWHWLFAVRKWLNGEGKEGREKRIEVDTNFSTCCCMLL